MPELLPGALPAGIIIVLTVILLRAQAHIPRISFLKTIMIGIAGAYLIPAVLAFLNETWVTRNGCHRCPSSQEAKCSSVLG